MKKTDYDNWWKKIDVLLEKEGLWQSALKEVKTVQETARREKKEDQELKALVYRIQLESALTEGSDTAAIRSIRSQLSGAGGVKKALLHCLLAGYYKQYFDHHRWQLYDRTAVAGANENDFLTWGPAEFQQQISQEFREALAARPLLQATENSAYKAIVQKGNSPALRPTLYDLVAWQALNYFTGPEPLELVQAADGFRLNDAFLFAEAPVFLAQVFPQDTTSNHAQALSIFQELLRLHEKDRNAEAFDDANLHRLEFAHRFSNLPDKTERYRAALSAIAGTTGTTDAAGTKATAGSSAGAQQALFLLASSWKEATLSDLPKAAALAKKLVATAPNGSRYAQMAANLLLNLEATELELKAEKVNLPQEPFRVLLTYKNLKKLYWRVIAVDDKLLAQLDEDGDLFGDETWPQMKHRSALRSWEEAIPDSNDYNSHRIELKVDALPKGTYLLLVADKPEFDTKSTALAATVVFVSGISYIQQQQDYFILDRNNGRPLAGATVQAWRQDYNANDRKYRFLKAGRYTANDQGYVHLDEKQGGNYRLEISTANDRLYLNNREYIYRSQPGNTGPAARIQYHTWFFLDRAIYRPGQTLHFKAIVTTREENAGASSIAANHPATILLYNANGQATDSLQLRTNEYGSVSGSFRLPQTGLTGGFRLQGPEGSAYFQVEEYKRPRFSVEIQPLEGSYRLNDSIPVKGKAIAYAGNSISNAKLTYRVTRSMRMPYPIMRKIWPPVRSADVEIINGSIETAADGSFSFDFPAIPDPAIAKNADTRFEYRIEVAVTDLNGESREANTSYTLGYRALVLDFGALPEAMTAAELQKITLLSRNAGGLFEAAQAELQLLSLQAPGRMVRERLWEAPDRYSMDETSFLRYFPNDEYYREADPATWKTGEVVQRFTDSTHADGSFALAGFRPKTGWYRLHATARDRFGETVSAEKTIFVYDAANPLAPQGLAFLSLADSSRGVPGQTINFLLGSSFPEIFLVSQRGNRETEKEKTPFSQLYTTEILKAGMHARKYTLQQNDLGGMGWNHVFVYQNRIYQSAVGVQVPWLDKELQVEVESFRDKALPGSEEKWTLSIKGSKGEKIAAELLTSMYDVSLDQFAGNTWQKPSPWPVFGGYRSWNAGSNITAVDGNSHQPDLPYKEIKPVVYDELFPMLRNDEILSIRGGKPLVRGMANAAPGNRMKKLGEVTVLMDASVGYISQEGSKDEAIAAPAPPGENQTPQPTGPAPANTARTNFQETAFFFPALYAGKDGRYSFSFTLPESLSRWRWQMLAHTKELAFGYAAKEMITQKELMVQPNMPRFLREGDQMEISAKIVNLGDQEITGQAELQLFDPATNTAVDGWFNNFFPNQYFTVAAGGSEAVKFPIQVPFLYGKALGWRIIARSGDKSDGESNQLPVLSNRELITESLPFFLNGSQGKKLEFRSLLESGNSESLSHQGLTVEWSSNPAWYAVQALPYLNDYPYECAEQTFNRLYANLLAAGIVQRMPKIKTVLEKWATGDTSAFLSNLEKNQELKQALLEETPWVLAAKSESEQKRRVAELFNLVRLQENTAAILARLTALQTANGGFSWFSGGPDDRFITQYIVTGIGRLKKMNALGTAADELLNIARRAIPYLDARLQDDYRQRDKKNTPSLNIYAVQWLYLRSYFTETGINGSAVAAASFYRNQARENWIKGNRMIRGMIALALSRSGDPVTAKKIQRSLEETAIKNEDLGMYWKENTPAYYWQDAPIETQSLMVETFAELGAPAASVNALKTWLLRNKQSNHWPSTKSTADACYALLLQGSNWLDAEPRIQLSLGNTKIQAEQEEAGTGYYQQKIEGAAVQPQMGNIAITVNHPVSGTAKTPVWGAIYWQYFEDLDRIGTAGSTLGIRKRIFLEKPGAGGIQLIPVGEGTELKVGDKLRIRLELSSDRNMEYVQVKDQRASNLEPVDVLSGYSWNGGLGYYKSPRDASMQFFIDRLPKGTHVLEYTLFAAQAGQFSNGIAKAQCMYAPEFTAHSGAEKLRVE